MVPTFTAAQDHVVDRGRLPRCRRRRTTLLLSSSIAAACCRFTWLSWTTWARRRSSSSSCRCAYTASTCDEDGRRARRWRRCEGTRARRWRWVARLILATGLEAMGFGSPQARRVGVEAGAFASRRCLRGSRRDAQSADCSDFERRRQWWTRMCGTGRQRPTQLPRVLLGEHRARTPRGRRVSRSRSIWPRRKAISPPACDASSRLPRAVDAHRTTWNL